MRDVQALIDAVHAAGVTIRTSGTNLVINPASKVPPRLKSRLKENKAELLRRLKLEGRLTELGISIAIDKVTGSAMLLFKVSDAEIVRDIAAVYQPYQTELTPSQRRQLSVSLEYSQLKTCVVNNIPGGIVSWKLST